MPEKRGQDKPGRVTQQRGTSNGDGRSPTAGKRRTVRSPNSTAPSHLEPSAQDGDAEQHIPRPPATPHSTPSPPRTSGSDPVPGPSKRDVELARIASNERGRLYEHIFGLFNRIVVGIVIIVPFYIIYLGLVALAGHSDALKSLATAVVSMKVNEWLPWVIACLSTGGFVSERRLRQRTISGREDYVRQLEEQLDPHRSSSGLTKTGKPQQGDHNAT